MRRLGTALLALTLAGCARKEPPPAASSSLSRDAAVVLAGRFTQSIAPPMSFDFVDPTGSMRPAIDEKSVILLEPYKGQALRVGDIVVYVRPEGRRVIHRIVELQPEGVITKGDANEGPDGLVRWDQITNRYVGQIVFSKS